MTQNSFPAQTMLHTPNEDAHATGRQPQCNYQSMNVRQQQVSEQPNSVHATAEAGPSRPPQHEKSYGPDVYPGVSLGETMCALKDYFNGLWEPVHETRAAGEDEDDNFEDYPLKCEDFEPLFEIGEVVHIRSASASDWTEFHPAFDGHCSKQTFKIEGRWLKTSHPGRFGDDGVNFANSPFDSEGNFIILTDNAGSDMVPWDNHTMDLSEAIKRFSMEDNNSKTQRTSTVEEHCWYYKLVAIDETLTLPVANVMLWREDNLVWDAEAMDLDEEEDDAEESESDTESEAGTLTPTERSTGYSPPNSGDDYGDTEDSDRSDEDNEATIDSDLSMC